MDVARPTALAITATGLACYACLCPLAGLISDRVGRRPSLLVGCAGMALAALPLFALLATGAPPLAVAGMVLFAAFQALVNVNGVVILVELFPAATRVSGSAIGYNLGLALIAGPGPLIAAALAATTGGGVSPGLYVLAVALAAALVLQRWLVETRGRPLREEPRFRRDPAAAQPVRQRAAVR